MKLLLDEKLSPRLVPRLISLFTGLTHVRDVGLEQAHDRAIWEWAKVNGRDVITADSDFVKLSQQLGWPPKVIHIEQCVAPFRVVEDMRRRSAVRSAEFDKDKEVGALVLRFLGK